jgi:uncharacterized protein YjbI with pentapeptide repeats
VADPRWVAQLPQESESTFPDSCGDEDPVDLHDRRFTGAVVASAASTERPEIVNTVFERCDVAGFVGQHGRAERVLLTETRLRGALWSNGLVRDAQFTGVIALETSFRFSELRRVLFRDCQLPGIDFTRASFDEVRFENCDLVGATFDAARASGPLRIERCDLTNCSGVEALRGASIHPDDLMAFAPSMARALGFIVE